MSKSKHFYSKKEPLAAKINPSESLFGISGKSNREASTKSHWGKNEFNSSFPIALLCYMHSKKLSPVYLKLNKKLGTDHDFLPVDKLFQIDPLNSSAYFSFEDAFVPHQKFVQGQLPRCDVVIMDNSDRKSTWRSGFEVKLTALPDNSTYLLSDDRQSCEMVFRPTAIIHLALNIAHSFRDRKQELLKILAPAASKIFNWRRPEDIIHLTDEVVEALDSAFINLIEEQEPFIIQPIWKTVGKKSILHDDCLDVFVWSNFAFTRLFFDMCEKCDKDSKKMKRHQRCVFWLMRMLYDFAQIGVINPTLIASEMAYELQTDKAFSASGRITWSYLKGSELTKPRIKKNQIREIILNGGEKMLSPERRFDAAIVNSSGIF